MNQLVLRSFYQETQNSLGIHYCAFGCGKLATFYSPQYNRYRCRFSASSCESVKKEKSKYRHSPEAKRLMSVTRTGKNNGFFGKKHSEKTRKRLSESKTGPNHPWFGKHLPAATREKISAKSTVTMSKYDGVIGAFRHVKTYTIENLIGSKFKLHGKWEVKMAELLNSKGVIWEKSKSVTYMLNGAKHLYTPDFYLPLYNKYIEVKGYYPEKCQLKMKLVHEQNPDLCILMAFKYEIDHLEEFYEKNLQESVSRQVLS